MGAEYEEYRKRTLRNIATMIGQAAHEPWSICMQHETSETEKIRRLCLDAGRGLSGCLTDAIGRLEQGAEVGQICNIVASPWKHRPEVFPRTAAGGTASALADAGLLIVSVDPAGFAAKANGRIHADVHEYLNSSLHGWMLQLQRQWRLHGLQHAVTPSIFEAPIPPPEAEKASLGTMVRALMHALHIGRERPSPLKNRAAAVFSNTFRIKLWPHLRELPAGPPDRCTLVPVSTAFQEWYFGVGRTQLEQPTLHAARAAETAFVDLREQFHRRSRSCAGPAQSGCEGQCLEQSFAAVADSPFKERCRQAVTFIRSRHHSHD